MNELLQDFSSAVASLVDQQLQSWTLAAEAVAPRVTEAMRYSLMNGGKRIRPILAFAAAQAVAEPNDVTLTAACAVECIHAYSLIHDDLPAMDNDDLRRGKPTCHIAFDEATAILAGDGLQTLAFEKLAMCAHVPEIALSLVKDLALASGDKGMVAGQMIDMEAERRGDAAHTLAQLEQIHRHKTGALIRAAVLMGARSVSATRAQLDDLCRYAETIGLAFQVQDDIIDVTSDTATLGKQQGADQALGKATYVSLLGLEQARLKAHELHESALNALAGFDAKADPLRWVASYIVNRDH